MKLFAALPLVLLFSTFAHAAGVTATCHGILTATEGGRTYATDVNFVMVTDSDQPTTAKITSHGQTEDVKIVQGADGKSGVMQSRAPGDSWDMTVVNVDGESDNGETFGDTTLQILSDDMAPTGLPKKGIVACVSTPNP